MNIHRRSIVVTAKLSVFLLVGIIAGNAQGGNSARNANREVTDPMPYAVDTNRIDTADDFNAFLARCSLEERVCLMQSMMGLGAAKIERHHFGKVAGLRKWNDYADSRRKATSEKPVRPKTYNDVPPATVIDAIVRAILPESLVSPDAIRRELQWCCFSKVRFHFFNHKRVDYHKEALQWVCKKKSIPDAAVKSLSTFTLENKLAERSFEWFWDKLSPEQRLELLGNVENLTKSKLNDKVKIAAMTSGTLLAHMDLFTIYSAAAATSATAAGFATASVAGPGLFYSAVGWGLGAISLGIQTAIIYNWPDSQRTANFVITAHLIKERWKNNSSLTGEVGVSSVARP